MVSGFWIVLGEKMKKYLVLLLAALSLVTFASCDDSGQVPFASCDDSGLVTLAPCDDSGQVTKEVTSYDELKAALEDVNVGVVKLAGDIGITTTLAINREVTLDANGKTISNTTDLWDSDKNNYSLFSVRGEGNLTVTGNGSFLVKGNDDCYAFDVQGAGAKLTIESGTAKGNISVVCVFEGEATIQGGEYSLQKGNGQNPYAYTLDIELDPSNTAGTAKITVTGGKFYKFDPAASEGEDPVANFVADGYQSVQDGDWYVVSAK